MRTLNSLRAGRAAATFVVSGALLLSAFGASALTTVGLNIDTGGTLTVAGNATFDTNTLFVDAANNAVGMGTATPGAPLDVWNNSASNAQILTLTKPQTGGGGAADQGGYILFRGGASASPVVRGYFGFTQTTGGTTTILTGAPVDAMALRAQGDLLFGAGGDNTRLFIRGSDGFVGMGTITPANQVHVASTSTDSTGVNIQNTSVGGRQYVLLSTGSANAVGVGKFAIYDAGAGTVRMAVTSAGDVGIGTTAPGAKLEVNGAIKGTALDLSGGAINNLGATGASLTRSGAHSLALVTSANSTVSLPASGTLATLAGTETFTNKTLTSPTISGGTIDNTPIGNTTRANGAFSGLSTLNTMDIGTTNASEDVLRITVATGGASRFNGTLTNADLTASRTWTLPDSNGMVLVRDSGDTVAQGNLAIWNNGTANVKADGNNLNWNFGGSRLIVGSTAADANAVNARLYVNGTPLTGASADASVSALKAMGDFGANTTASKTFYGTKIGATFNLAGSTQPTSVNVLEINTTNTDVTQLTANLIHASYGNSPRLIVPSYGALATYAYWDEPGTAFYGIRLDATDTASLASSRLLDLRVGGTSKFAVGKTGSLSTSGDLDFANATGTVNTGSVTINDANFGRITLGTAVAASGVTTFTLVDNRITTTSVILVSLCSTPANSTILTPFVSAISAGSATIGITNGGASPNPATEICFAIFN